MNKKLKFTSW